MLVLLGVVLGDAVRVLELEIEGVSVAELVVDSVGVAERDTVPVRLGVDDGESAGAAGKGGGGRGETGCARGPSQALFCVRQRGSHWCR